MIIYFTDRQMNLLGSASTTLPNGYRIIDDLLTEDVDTGVNVFTLTVYCNGEDRNTLENISSSGHFILKKSNENYDSLYQIIETEFDTATESLYLYCEDCGLDLLNKTAPSADVANKSITDMLRLFVPSDWTIDVDTGITGTKSYTWTGENTCIERINSVANLWEADVYFSFEIKGFKVTDKILHIVKKRGSVNPVAQLRTGREISGIKIKKSIANLATALSVTGDEIDLKNYTYNYTDENGDTFTVDKSTGQVRCTSQMNNWSSVLDNNGLLLKTYDYQTKDKAVLAGAARAELQKMIYPVVNYDVDIIRLPEGIKIGDRINIIDEEGELYLDSRVLKLESSECTGRVSATIGESQIKQSGIADIVQSLASEFSSKVKNGIDGIVLSVLSSGGNYFHNTRIDTTLYATVFYGNMTIENQTDLEAALGSGSSIIWYKNNERLGTGFSLPVSTDDKQVSISAKLYIEGGN